MNNNSNRTVALVMAALLLLPWTVFAEPVKDGVAPRVAGVSPSNDHGPAYGWDGTLPRALRIDPVTGKLSVSLGDPGFAWTAGTDADTTIKVAAGPGWYDNDSAPWTTANLYPWKALYIKVTTGVTANTIVFRIQGSFTGSASDYSNIYLVQQNGGAVATVDTLQIVTDANGAPFGTAGGYVSLNDWTVGASAIKAADVLRPYPYLRCVVQNRGTSQLTYTIKWGGSQ